MAVIETGGYGKPPYSTRYSTRAAVGPGSVRAESNRSTAVEQIELVPFFEAGNREPGTYRDGVWQHIEPVTKITFQVWLPIAC